jgi:hypothetical protein
LLTAPAIDLRGADLRGARVYDLLTLALAQVRPTRRAS